MHSESEFKRITLFVLASFFISLLFYQEENLSFSSNLLNTLFFHDLIAFIPKVSRYILIITHVFENIEEIFLHIFCNCA